MSIRSSANIHNLVSVHKNYDALEKKKEIEQLYIARNLTKQIVNDLNFLYERNLIEDHKINGFISKIELMMYELANETSKKIGEYEQVKRSIVDDKILTYSEKGTTNNKDSKHMKKIRSYFDIIFNIEEVFFRKIRKYWKYEMTDFNAFENNGDDFMFLVEPVYFEEKKEKDYKKASLISNKQIELNDSKIGIVYDFDEDAILGMSSLDFKIKKRKKEDVNTIFKKDGYNYISTNRVDLGLKSPKKRYHSKLKLPKDLIDANQYYSKRLNESILSSENVSIYNEVILDKEKVTPKGIVIITSGIDFVFDEFILAKEIQEKLNVPIKVVNKGVYREKNELPFYDNVEGQIFLRKLKEFDNDNFSRFGKTKEEISNLLKEYIKEVIEKANYKSDYSELIKNDVLSKRCEIRR